MACTRSERPDGGVSFHTAASPPCISHSSSGRSGLTFPDPSSSSVPPGTFKGCPRSLGPHAGPLWLCTRCLSPVDFSRRCPTGLGSQGSPVVTMFGSRVKINSGGWSKLVAWLKGFKGSNQQALTSRIRIASTSPSAGLASPHQHATRFLAANAPKWVVW